MPTESSEDAIARWRALAEDTRLVAEQTTDPEARRSLLIIAAVYERIAKRAEARAIGNPAADK